MNFESFELHPKLLQALGDLGFTEPTPIQVDAIPPGLEGRDVLACAMTGSGKTAAYLLPILQQLVDAPERRTRGLVLTPTRELAAQVAEHLQSLAQHTEIRVATVYGGVAMGPQEQAFRDRVDVVVATPGRLLDHLRNRYADLNEVEYLVLDEADRMLDMGFLPDVERILEFLPEERQTFFLSATIPPPVAELSQQLLNQAVMINIDRPAAPATGVRQAVYPVPEDLKRAMLLEMLKPDEIRNVLVFTRTKHRSNRLAQFLRRQGISADRIHGNRTQAQRSAALKAFQDGKSRVLVATNVAARGIDIRKLSHVINYDVPEVPDDYIHRVGRTARAQETGDALTFVAPHEEIDLRAIERLLGRELPRLTVDDFDYNAKAPDRLEQPAPERLAEMRARRQARRRGKEKPVKQERRPSSGKRRRRSRSAKSGAGPANGNVEGSHEQSHVDILNPNRQGRKGQRGGHSQKAKRRRRKETNGNVLPSGANGREVNGNVAPPERRKRLPHDEEQQPNIPAAHDLPPRRTGRPARPSHEPAAFSSTGRRFHVQVED